jgi:hypothetical protein
MLNLKNKRTNLQARHLEKGMSILFNPGNFLKTPRRYTVIHVERIDQFIRIITPDFAGGEKHICTDVSPDFPVLVFGFENEDRIS